MEDIVYGSRIKSTNPLYLRRNIHLSESSSITSKYISTQVLPQAAMAITNVSGNRTQKTLHQLICTTAASWTAGASVNLPISAEYISVHHCISGKYYNPTCSPQGVFTSSVIKNFVTLSGNN